MSDGSPKFQSNEWCTSVRNGASIKLPPIWQTAHFACVDLCPILNFIKLHHKHICCNMSLFQSIHTHTHSITKSSAIPIFSLCAFHCPHRCLFSLILLIGNMRQTHCRSLIAGCHFRAAGKAAYHIYIKYICVLANITPIRWPDMCCLFEFCRVLGTNEKEMLLRMLLTGKRHSHPSSRSSTLRKQKTQMIQ